MSQPRPRFILIGGPNGAGKTTAAYQVLPNPLACLEYLNADEIARGLSPLNPSSVAVTAGKHLINRAQHLLNYQMSFAMESTLASKTPYKFLLQAKEAGYEILIFYFWLGSPELAIDRVAFRVSQGGHHVPEADIRLRYSRSAKNFQALYADKADYWAVYDNSTPFLKLLATHEQTLPNRVIIHHEQGWQRFSALSASS